MKKCGLFVSVFFLLIFGVAAGYMLIIKTGIPAARVTDAGGVWAQAANPQGRINRIQAYNAAGSADGGICVAGSAFADNEPCSEDAECRKLFITKFDRNGKQLWFRTIEGMDKSAFGVTATPDGGCAATGMAAVVPKKIFPGEDPTGIFFDLFFVKYNPDGKRCFYRQFSNARHKSLGGSDIASLPNGDLIISGGIGPLFRQYPNCPWMLRISPDGKVLRQAYDCDEYPRQYENISVAESGTIYTFMPMKFEHKSNHKEPETYYYCEQVFSSMSPFFKAIKYVEKPFEKHGAMCINDAVTNDNYGFAAGYAHSKEEDIPELPLIVKYKPDFTPLWKKTYDAEVFLNFYHIIATSDGGALAGGDYMSGKFSPTPFLMKTDSDGNVLWLKYYEPELFGGTISIFERKTGGYIIIANPAHFPDDVKKCIGKHCPQFWVISIDKNGNGPASLTSDKPLMLDY